MKGSALTAQSMVVRDGTKRKVEYGFYFSEMYDLLCNDIDRPRILD